MKSIALIHTVKTVAVSFDETLKQYVGEEVKVHNLWDDFLANNPNLPSRTATASFLTSNQRR